MTEQIEHLNPIDPIEMLRAADPADPQTVPSASLARVSARIQENIMSDIENNPGPAARVRRRFALVGLVGTVAVVALVAVIAAPRGVPAPGGVAVVPSASAVTVVPSPSASAVAVVPSEEPSSGGPNTGGGGSAMCIRYDTSILATLDFGFDGIVTAVQGDQVAFAVIKAYKGVNGESLTLTSPGNGVGLQGGGLDFALGDHLLVAGSGSTISGCGYTQAYDPAVAAEWATAFGG